MNLQEFNGKSLQRACLGNGPAMDWLDKWRAYCHGIDDIEDTKTTTEFRLHTFMLAFAVYNHPFYLQHAATLGAHVANITNTYAQCVAWEKADEPWQRDWADHHRHCAVEMVLVVANLLGGYVHLRSVTAELHASCYHGHHDKKGKAV